MPTQFIGREGTKLVTDGRPYRFTGFNIYNANSVNGDCWYHMGSGTALEHSLTQIGDSQSVFRAWFRQHLVTFDGRRDWTPFDHTLAVAAAHHERVVVNLVGQDSMCDGDVYHNLSWYQSGYRTDLESNWLLPYRDYVQEVVSRYRDNPTVLMWQLVNEAEAYDYEGAPCEQAKSAQALRHFADDVGGTVKRIDHNHLVSLGTIGTGQCGTTYTDYQYVHASPGIDLCEAHDYKPEPMPGDRWNGLRERLNQCGALNKPLFVGETGIKTSAVGGSLNARADAFRAKFSSQFHTGVVGELVWNWRDGAHGGSSDESYDVGPRDPILPVLADYRSG